MQTTVELSPSHLDILLSSISPDGSTRARITAVLLDWTLADPVYGEVHRNLEVLLSLLLAVDLISLSGDQFVNLWCSDPARLASRRTWMHKKESGFRTALEISLDDMKDSENIYTKKCALQVSGLGE